MKYGFASFVLLSISCSSAAFAFPKTTVAELQKQCEHTQVAVPSKEDIAAAYECRGYVQAAQDSNINNHGNYYCRPLVNLSLEQDIELFLHWAKLHPDQSNIDAAEGIAKSTEIKSSSCSPAPKGMPPIP